MMLTILIVFFVFKMAATTEIYTLSLHDALPISPRAGESAAPSAITGSAPTTKPMRRSEEHTSELQSQSNLVCRLLLEKKKYPSDYRTMLPLLTVFFARELVWRKRDALLTENVVP